MTHLSGVPTAMQTGVIFRDGVQVPVFEPTWLDERTGCAQAHRYLGGEIDGGPEHYETCDHLRKAGGCARNGHLDGGTCRSKCLFHERLNSKGWRDTRRWALMRLPDGSEAFALRSEVIEIAEGLGAVVVDGPERVSA